MSQIFQPQRNGLIAKIHIAKKDMGLDESLYRELLYRVTGKDSTRDMNVEELEFVLDEFKTRGWKPSPARKAGVKRIANQPQAKMIRALWIELREAGQLEDSSENALNKFVKRTCGVDNMIWLKPGDANVVINALRGWLKRVGVKA